MHGRLCVEARVCPLCLPWGTWKVRSSCQALWQVSVTSKPSCQAINKVFCCFVLSPHCLGADHTPISPKHCSVSSLAHDHLQDSKPGQDPGMGPGVARTAGLHDCRRH